MLTIDILQLHWGILGQIKGLWYDVVALCLVPGRIFFHKRESCSKSITSACVYVEVWIVSTPHKASLSTTVTYSTHL